MKPRELTQKLIEFNTVTGNLEEIERALEFIEECFDNSFSIYRFEEEGVKSLLITSGGLEDIRIILHGHLDVVEADKELFEPEIKNGKIYGRGSADMKSGLACIMNIVKQQENEALGILITSDEEKGGFNGTGHVIEETEIRPKLVISAEPDDSRIFPSIVNKQKGVLQLRASVEGKSSHASKPEKGENAIEKLMNIYAQDIRPLFDHHKEFSTTVNIGKIVGGESVNKVPNAAELHLDIRYSAQYPKEEVLEDLESIQALNIEVTAQAPMMSTSQDEEILKNLNNSICQVCGKKGGFRSEAFASDMRFFTSRDIPAVCFGPEGYNLHGQDEYVEVESLETYCEILKNFLQSELT
ncbi:MAG: M20/M25/M40 family metallo-hydrolase [Candidatus Nanohaloarchaea archaeon]